MNGLPFVGMLLVCDMDGTLLNSMSQVSDENKAAAERFVRGGGLFTIATGRIEKTVERFSQILPINAPAILYNGAAVHDLKSRKTLWQNFLGKEVKGVVKALAENYPELGIEIFHGGDVYQLHGNEETEKHKIKEGFTAHEVPLEEVPDAPWFKVLLAWEPEKLKEVELFLKEKTEEFQLVYSEPEFLEIMHMNASKGRALERLARMLGILPYNIVAVGNNLNDSEMLKIAGIGVAVDNAHEDLKKIARVCGCHHNEHIVSWVVQMLEKGGE